jgi:hypothetical protein
MSSNYRRQRGKSSSQEAGGKLLGLVLIFSVALVFAFAGWYYVSNKEDLSADGCPKDRSKRSGVAVVLIDVSSAFTADQRQALKIFADKLVKVLPRYTELKLYKISDSGLTEKEKLLSVCSPGDPSDPAQVNVWTQNQKIAYANWKNGFAGKIDKEISSISVSAGLQKSPIIESIRSVSLFEFGADPSLSSKQKYLFVVSDLVQYSNMLDFFHSAPSFEQFKSSSQYSSSLSRLSGVRVELLLLENEPRIQTSNFRDFWLKYIADNGGAARIQSLIQFDL